MVNSHSPWCSLGHGVAACLVAGLEDDEDLEAGLRAGLRDAEGVEELPRVRRGVGGDDDGIVLLIRLAGGKLGVAGGDDFTVVTSAVLAVAMILSRWLRASMVCWFALASVT